MTAFRRARLGRLGRTVGTTVLDGIGRVASRLHESQLLDADVLESDEAYLVIVDAPGATASEIQVRYVDDAVLVRVDRFREARSAFEMRLPGRGLSLDGRVTLPDDATVDPNGATATLRDNGTLEICLPKRSPDPDDGDD